MHEFFRKYGPFVVGGILLFALLYYVFVARKAGESKLGNPNYNFFVDEETGEESVHPNSELPPLIGASGKPTVVVAVKWACQDGSNVKTVYLQRYTPEALEKLRAMGPDDLNRSNVMTEGEQLRDPSPGSSWVSASSDAAAQLRTPQECADKKPMAAYYPDK
jgi:hypothetical protein